MTGCGLGSRFVRQVNTSLLALARLGVFCTEPFRIPFAGRLDVCAFDKTGTLTADELVFEGVAAAGDGAASSAPGAAAGAASASGAAAAAAAGGPEVGRRGSGQEERPEEPPESAGGEALRPGARAEAAPRRLLLDGECDESSLPAAFVLGACHALVVLDGKLVGDPLERAALAGIGWAYTGSDVASAKAPLRPRASAAAAASAGGAGAAGGAGGGTPGSKQKAALGAGPPLRPALRILKRHHFSPELRRMSVVARTEPGTVTAAAAGTYVLCKGAPEAVLELCANVPTGVRPPCKRCSSVPGRPRCWSQAELRAPSQSVFV